MKGYWSDSILIRYWVAFTFVGLLVAGPLILFFQRQHRQALEEQLVSSHAYQSRFIASALEQSMRRSDFAAVNSLLLQSEELPSFVFAALVETNSVEERVFECYPDSMRAQVLVDREGWFSTRVPVTSNYFDGELVLGWTDEEVYELIAPAQRPIAWLALIAVIGSVVLFWLVFRAVARPIQVAAQYADSLVNESGQFRTTLEEHGQGEFSLLNRSLNKLTFRLSSFEKENKELLKNLQQEVNDRSSIIAESTNYTSMLLEVSAILMQREEGVLGSNYHSAISVLQQAIGIEAAAIVALNIETGLMCAENQTEFLSIDKLSEWIEQNPTLLLPEGFALVDSTCYIFPIDIKQGDPRVQRFLGIRFEVPRNILVDQFKRFGLMLGTVLSSYNQRLFSELHIREINADLERKVLQKLKQNLDLSNSLVSQDKLATIGELAAQVAHDLNTPLGAITASAENARILQDRLIQNALEYDRERFAVVKSFAERICAADHSGTSWVAERSHIHGILDSIAPGGNWNGIAMRLAKMGCTSDHEPLYKYIVQEDDPEGVLSSLSLLIDSHRSFETLVNAADKSARVANSLRHFVKDDDYGVKNDVNLCESLRTVLNLLDHRKDVGFQLRFDVPKDLNIKGVEIKLFQLWSNVLKNGLDALEESDKAHRELGVKAFLKDDYVHVSLGNNGPAIPKDVQKQIFKKFYTSKSGAKGTGLGLSIVQNVLLEHRGRVVLESDDEWTSFNFSFPVE